MTRKIAMMAVAAFLTVVAGPALADDHPALRAAVESYVRHPVTQGTLDDILSIDTLRSALVAQLQARGARLRSDQIEVVSQIAQEEFDRIRPQIETLMTKAAIETYSLEEIQAFNEFLNTDIGARAMAKAGEMMRAFTAGAGPALQQLFERLGARIEAELPK